ncbi:MAG: hypothetical protein Q9216_005295, partial [Gyalolechia sp. 2 TL-2023]
MSSRYVPPHLRGQQPSASSSTTLPKKRDPSDGYTPSEIANQFNLSSKPGTLNASDNDPGKLAFVLVYKDQHPDWETERKLLCKTNLHLLSSSPAPDSQTQSKDNAAPSGTVNEAGIADDKEHIPAPPASSAPPTQLKEPSIELAEP